MEGGAQRLNYNIIDISIDVNNNNNWDCLCHEIYVRLIINSNI